MKKKKKDDINYMNKSVSEKVYILSLFLNNSIQKENDFFNLFLIYN